MIQCKRVYEDAAPDDGYRVLVDRLWPRGIKKEDLVYDEWCKNLTPSAELRKAYHGEVIDFPTFCQDYREELSHHRDDGMRLAEIADKRGLTLIYAATNTTHNHARVLADWVKNL